MLLLLRTRRRASAACGYWAWFPVSATAFLLGVPGGELDDFNKAHYFGAAHHSNRLALVVVVLVVVLVVAVAATAAAATATGEHRP